MPEVFRDKGFRFLFYSNERSEPCHVHVIGQGGEAKFWIPSCQLVRTYNLNPTQLRTILGILRERVNEIEEKWDEHFGQ